jgi:hypothetical protein
MSPSAGGARRAWPEHEHVRGVSEEREPPNE